MQLKVSFCDSLSQVSLCHIVFFAFYLNLHFLVVFFIQIGLQSIYIFIA